MMSNSSGEPRDRLANNSVAGLESSKDKKDHHPRKYTPSRLHRKVVRAEVPLNEGSLEDSPVRLVAIRQRKYIDPAIFDLLPASSVDPTPVPEEIDHTRRFRMENGVLVSDSDPASPEIPLGGSEPESAPQKEVVQLDADEKNIQVSQSIMESVPGDQEVPSQDITPGKFRIVFAFCSYTYI
jgi:hypothetical protein